MPVITELVNIAVNYFDAKKSTPYSRVLIVTELVEAGPNVSCTLSSKSQTRQSSGSFFQKKYFSTNQMNYIGIIFLSIMFDAKKSARSSRVLIVAELVVSGISVTLKWILVASCTFEPPTIRDFRLEETSWIMHCISSHGKRC